ncbi:MAG: methyltransferase domain-containing protein [Alphaproteobacteria bacterium]|nr:methyltransferase domain-containing protein [Alphaproteobacteria bacterium]
MSLNDWPADPVDEARQLVQAGRAGEAAARLSSLIEAGRGGLLARLTLVDALLAEARQTDAVAAARELTQLAPQWADAAVAFGRALIAHGALPTGIGELHRALRLEPVHPGAELALAEAWADAGEVEKAQTHLERAVAGGKDGRGVAARLAAMDEAKRADAGFVRHLFDQFSTDYDARMRGRLGYRAPEILLELALMVGGGRLRKTATLDLGCGTGLAAPAFRPFATSLTGVDLSPQMIAQAEAAGHYDALTVNDIEAWSFATPQRFGRVVAADVFVYLGDLTRVFQGVRRILRPGGLFLFTTERNAGADDFMLQETRRYAHGESYIQRLAAESGYDVRGLIHCTPRYNAGQAIPGLAAALMRI